jgi:hypothetical protein
MKIFKLAILTAIAFMAFSSCQKELVFSNDGTSVGTFKKDGGGNCLPVVINGIFKADSVLTNTLFVDIQVNVSTPGTFDIKSDTVNGYSFSKTGTVAFGINTIRLYPSGKPLVAGKNTFTVKYGSSTCSYDITVTGPTSPAASFTLAGSPGVCAGVTPGGTYTVGVALTPSNTLTLQVNVINPGSYVIGAVASGGFIFTGSGVFISGGLQNVTLTGSGTPTTAGTSSVSVTNLASSCTYDITVLPAGGAPAVFTLDGAPANACTSYIVAGTYMQGIAATAANTVKLNVTVTTAGSYSITTNSLNGISFSGSGVLALGAQTITLTASGAPTTQGTFNYKPNVTSTCGFDITVAPPPSPAVYTLKGSPAACAPMMVHGLYYTSTALNATNTVDVDVDVSSPGSYTLSTNTVNGIKFSATGIFTATGVKTVTLLGSGTTGATAGTTTLTPQTGTSSCTFDVVVAAAPTGTYSCKIDGVFTSFTDRAMGENMSFGTPNLYLNGYTGPPSGGSVPQFQIFIDKNDGSPITAGTYNGNSYILPNGHHIEIDYTLENPDMTVTIWNTSSTLFPPPNPPFTITVTSITATRAIGTFSGTLTNTLQGGTLFKVITEGVFNLPIQ